MRQITRSPNTQILLPEEVSRLQAELGNGQIVVIQQQPKPWGWIVFGVIMLVMMAFSFLNWLVVTVIAHADKQTERAHDLSLKAMELAGQTQAANPGMSEASIWGLAFLLLIGIISLIAAVK